MIKIDPDAAYSKKDLAELFERTERTINRYYEQGLPSTSIRGMNYTFGYEIIAWMKNGGLGVAQEPTNPKLLKFRNANGL